MEPLEVLSWAAALVLVFGAGAMVASIRWWLFFRGQIEPLIAAVGKAIGAGSARPAKVDILQILGSALMSKLGK